MPDLVALSATLERSANALRIPYTVANHADVPVLVSVRTFLKGIPANRRPYSILREAASTLLLSFRTAPIPPGLLLNRPTLPLYALVPVGGQYQDHAEVEVPVQERHPYAEPDYPADARLATVTQVVFVVEYVLASHTNFLSKDEMSPAFFHTRGQPMVPLEISLALDAPLPVLKRTDDFYRW